MGNRRNSCLNLSTFKAKAVEGYRTPSRFRDRQALQNIRQVLECASPLALSPGRLQFVCDIDA
jgi:hypothetical protein